MRRLRYLPLPSLLVSSLVSTSVFAAPWVEDKAFFTENENLASSKVDAADLDGNGTIDLVFANGAGFDKGDNTSDLQQQVFLNDGATMTDISASIFENITYAARVVKLRDIDRDGDNDIILGTTWETQSQLLLNDGTGTFENATAMNLPQGNASVGDLEVGDVDGDGDLDIVLSNWGPAGAQTVATNNGGVTLLWSQMGKPGEFGGEGTGMFEDVTLGQMPAQQVRWSWELEFIDIDSDYDLDIIISANAGEKASLWLFTNDGAGTFTDSTAGSVVQGKFALDVEPMDLNGDGGMDLLTLHDGVTGRNRLLVNDKSGKFTDGTDLLWNKLDNPASYDTTAAFYDHDSNGKPDFLIGAFQNQYKDRLIYEANGKYKANTASFEETKVSGGTFAIVMADFNKDNRLDVAMAQNENAFEKKILIATEEVPVDTMAPFLTNIEPLGVVNYPGNEEIRLRVHDNKSPLMLHDFLSTDGKNEGFPYMETWATEPPEPLEDNPGDISTPGVWYGEYLWRVQFAVPDADVMWYRLCAIDAAGNKRCTELLHTEVHGGTATESDAESVTETMTASDTDSDSAVSATLSESDTESESNSNTMTATNTMTASESDTQASESMSDSTPTDSHSDGEVDSTPTETATASNSNGSVSVSESDTESATNSDTAFDSASELDDDGCGCDTNDSPVGGVLSSLALLGLLGIRRRRQS